MLAGGLFLFVGNEAKLHALDKDTGKGVFSKEMANGSAGVPAVYQVKRRHYVLFSLVAGSRFALGIKLPPGGVNPPVGQKSSVALALPQ